MDGAVVDGLMLSEGLVELSVVITPFALLVFVVVNVVEVDMVDDRDRLVGDGVTGR